MAPYDAICAKPTAAPVSIDRANRRFRLRPRAGPACVLGRCGRRLDRERATARQRAGEPTHRGLAASCAHRLTDPVNPAPLLFGRSKRKPELLLQSAREDAPHRMTLPSGG